MPLILVSPYQKLVPPPPPVAGRRYALLDPAQTHSSFTLSASKLSTTSKSSGYGTQADIGKSSGKWYWEVTIDQTASSSTRSSLPKIGIGRKGVVLQDNSHTGVCAVYYAYGYIWASGVGDRQINVPYTQGDVIGVALDADTKTVSFYKNGVLLVMGITDTRFAPDEVLYPVITDTNYSATDSPGLLCRMTANFGATPFKYPVPSGYNTGIF